MYLIYIPANPIPACAITIITTTVGAGRSAAGAGLAAAAAAAKAEREDSAERKEMTFRPRISKKSTAIAKTMGRDGKKVRSSYSSTVVHLVTGLG